jgi:ribokinase
MTRVAVVGHVEWVEFARVPRVPRQGEIVHASETWQEAGGGGAVAAVQLSRLAGRCLFLTALGTDAAGELARRQLATHEGVELAAAARPEAQRRAFTFVDPTGERTITVLGERMVPRSDDPLAWDRLEDVDGLYFTGGDADALRSARAARVLVSSSRVLDTLREARVALDVLVASATDPGETYASGDLDPEPRFVVRTAGAAGGEWIGAEGGSGRWRAAPVPGPVRDAYGCGDSFAAGLTFALASGADLPEALELGARCGAACLTGDGPYSGQLRLAGGA